MLILTFLNSVSSTKMSWLRNKKRTNYAHLSGGLSDTMFEIKDYNFKIENVFLSLELF